MTQQPDISKLDLDHLMRRAIELAQSARSKGNHPFGALLCDPDGNIVLEAENTVGTYKDVTCHAEQNLMSKASRQFAPAKLATLVMVTSTEPCAMCAGATFWTGGRCLWFLGCLKRHCATCA